jgi:elongation factor Ts
MTITASLVKELRDKTGLPMMKCKKALQENDGSIEKAEEALRKQGMKTEGRTGRSVSEGSMGSYIHHNGKIGVLIELACETDFVAKNEDFVKLTSDICQHIAASDPLCVSRDDVDEATIKKEKDIYAAQMEGKPENVIEKILEGKINAFFKERCLLDQPFIDDAKMSVQEHINTFQLKLGENISVKRFVRYQLGQ